MGFITKLSVENFFSVKNKVEIDFSASDFSIENNPERLFKYKNEYYNKVASIYGANASGKTTILKALTFLASAINNEKSDDFPVSIKNKYEDESTISTIELEFVLKIKGKESKYCYKAQFLSKEYKNIGFLNEKLTKINKKRNTVLFDRKKESIKNVDTNIIERVFENLLRTKSLIEEFHKFEKSETLRYIKIFFQSSLAGSNISAYNTKYGATSRDEMLIAQLLNKEDARVGALASKLNTFLLGFLSSINIDISEINIIFDEIDDKKEIKGIELKHDLSDDIYLDFKLESDGTQMLIKMLLDIFMIKFTSTSLIIDEFDSILHPMITPLIINLLIENDIQIIYSTHNIYNMKFLQNDEIFLIEKDIAHNSIVRPVKDITEIKGFENLLTAYENGRLGGIPNIKDIFTKVI